MIFTKFGRKVTHGPREKPRDFSWQYRLRYVTVTIRVRLGRFFNSNNFCGIMVTRGVARNFIWGYTF